MLTTRSHSWIRHRAAAHRRHALKTADRGSLADAPRDRYAFATHAWLA